MNLSRVNLIDFDVYVIKIYKSLGWYQFSSRSEDQMLLLAPMLCDPNADFTSNLSRKYLVTTNLPESWGKREMHVVSEVLLYFAKLPFMSQQKSPLQIFSSHSVASENAQKTMHFHLLRGSSSDFVLLPLDLLCWHFKDIFQNQHNFDKNFPKKRSGDLRLKNPLLSIQNINTPSLLGRCKVVTDDNNIFNPTASCKMNPISYGYDWRKCFAFVTPLIAIFNAIVPIIVLEIF